MIFFPREVESTDPVESPVRRQKIESPELELELGIINLWEGLIVGNPWKERERKCNGRIR